MRKACIIIIFLAASGFLAACAGDEESDLSRSERAPASESAQMAESGFPMFTAKCPSGLSAHADEGGPVFINGEEAVLKKFSERFFKAKKDDVTLSVGVDPGGALTVSYTARGGANGVCEVL